MKAKRNNVHQMKKADAARVSAAKATAKPPAPEWVTETPEQTEYWLVVVPAGGGGVEQDVPDITREEYIALKRYVAKLRGYAVPSAA